MSWWIGAAVGLVGSGGVEVIGRKRSTRASSPRIQTRSTMYVGRMVLVSEAGATFRGRPRRMER